MLTNDINSTAKFDIILLEKQVLSGLTVAEITEMCKYIDGEVYPIEIAAKEQECSAMGFITDTVANNLDYDYKGSGLNDFVAGILDNMDNEMTDGVYTFHDIRICLTRNILQ